MRLLKIFMYLFVFLFSSIDLKTDFYTASIKSTLDQSTV
jgi:hypothetical protein